MLLLIPHFNFALQVSLISEAKTDTDIWHTTGLEPKQCIQSNASAATREVWLWRKGWLSCLTFLRTFSFDRFNLLNANSVKKKKKDSNEGLKLFQIIVSDESERWAEAGWPREQPQQCSAASRVQHKPWVQHPAPPALCPPMCTTHQSWMNPLPSSRNPEKKLKAQRKRIKAPLPVKSR